MRFRKRRTTFAVAVLLAASFVAAGCPAVGEEEAVIKYDATTVEESNGMVMMGSEQPGRIFTAYEQEIAYPLSIETTAYLETTSESSETEGESENGGSERAAIDQGSVRVLGESSCEREQVDCNSDRCVVELSMSGDGYCVVSLRISAQSGVGASDCWGYGWVDGSGLSDEERTEEREKLVQARDDLCDDN